MVERRYEFYFRVAKQYFTNERREGVKYCFCHEKIKFISSSRRVMFFLLYRHADDGIFDDFPKISDHLPKVSEDFPKLFRIPDERFRTFSENLRRFPKFAEDFRGRPEGVSMIYQWTNLMSLNDTTLTKVTYGKYATRVPDEVAYGIYEWFSSQ